MSPQQHDSVVAIDNGTQDERQPLLTSSSNELPQNNDTVRNSKSEAIGLMLMALCALAFSSMSIFVKLSGASFPSFEIVFFRSVVQTVLGLAGTWWLGINPLGKRHIRPWLMVRGIVGGIALSSTFYSVTHMPLADATVILYLNPAFTTILAALVLGEMFGWFEGLCVALCFSGAVLVTKPGFLFESSGSPGSAGPLAVIAGLTGAILTAVAQVVIRKIGNNAHFLIHTIYFGVVGILISLPPLFTIQTFVMPSNWRECIALLMTGISAFIGQCLLAKGLQMTPAGPASVMRTNEVVLAFIFGIFIFNEYPDLLSVTGAAIIIATTTVLGSRRWRSAKSSH
ncbi:hypothetical protein BJV82DRAFT_670493 [Fennellomyces sp. T-0311]|nr:hypothetical protein BJV82DRAFT_670493 [Fennellomyces sp. T-0311]